MEELTINGMSISSGVVETIVSMSAKDVAGVAELGASAASGILNRLTSGVAEPPVEISAEDDKLCLAIHIQVDYGYPLPEIANNLRKAVADSIMSQLGLEVASIDVYIDGIKFN